MYKKKNLQKVFVLSLIMLTTILSAAKGVPDTTVVAEFDGGKITMGQLEERLSKIPPMYQPKYSNEEGKKQLLDMLCTEEVFYYEALQRNIGEDEKFFSRIDGQIKTAYFNEYNKELSAGNITFTSDEKNAYFKENLEMFAGRTYEESENEIEQRLRPQKEKDFMSEKTDKLNTKYKVEINYDLLEQINLVHVDSNDVIIDEILVSSTDPTLQKTVKDILDGYDIIQPSAQISLQNPQALKNYIDNLVKLDVFYKDAIENGFDKNEVIQEIVEQIKRNMMMRTVYNILVVDAIDNSDENAQEFYNNNIEKFSTKPYRKIQTFGFTSKDTAKKMMKLVKKYYKKNNEEALKQLIEEHSEYKAKDGILDHIYKNDIIPGIGKDEVYSDMVWKTKSDKLSKIFENSKGVFVFLNILEDNIAIPTPFEEIKGKIQSTMMKDLSKQLFDQTNAELQEKYHMKKYTDKLIVILTAEEYFNKAEDAQKRRRFTDAIFYYDEIIKHYQNNSDDYKATFMKAFLYAEELKDKDNAIKIFNEFLEKFPAADLHESAQFMISELEGKSDIIENFESEDTDE
ncbi:MAG: hypothetical protein ISS80_00115 [Candidatus Cloacimonetes bacterium]|nr:hypothetical protein [Candidatus Cloacimonadota bacterium]MBL7148461.1 hypothetical protein [Candidatus Cloacimonadota bacterium]